MKIYDVTVAISEAVPVYAGDPRVTIEGVLSMAAGDAANVSQLCFGAHTGTHVDAPNHFIDGTRRVEDLDIEKLIGPCRLVELDDSVTAIEPIHLAKLGGVERVLFKTRNSAFWNEPETGFRTDFTYITPDAARVLAAGRLKLVGIDYLSIEKFGSKDHAVHRAFLSHEVIILEGLNLSGVPAGKYELICLPLRLRSKLGDGAPARAVLRMID